jgi:multidrug efflux pump subunit AcrB
LEIRFIPNFAEVIKPNIPLITREALKYSIDILAWKDTATSSLVIMQAHMINKKFEKQLPPGIEIKDMGEMGTMKETLSKMAMAFLVGSIFTYFVLVVAFESLTAPLAIVLAIPLAAMDSMWFLLFANQHRHAPQ